MGQLFPFRASRTVLVVLAAGLSLAGCGRRGPLELPPGSPPQGQAATAAAQDRETRVLNNSDGPGLIQSPNTVQQVPASEQQQVFKAAPAPRAINAPPVARSSGFPLDPLL